MATKIINLSGRGGLAKKWGGDFVRHGYTGYTQTGQPNLRYLAEDGQMVSGLFNPVSKYGYMSPVSNTFQDISQATFATALANNINVSLVDDINKQIYFFEKDYIYNNQYDISGWDDTSVSALSVSRFTDATIYYLNGVRTAFAACDIGSAHRIITFNLTGAITPNLDWSSADVSGKFALYDCRATKLVNSGDGFLYVLNKNAVHRIDGTAAGGTNGTIYKDILEGPEGTILTHGIEYKNNLYIVVQQNEDWENSASSELDPDRFASPINNAGIYIWNRQSTFYNSSNFIQLQGVSHVRAIWVSPKNELLVMAVLPSGSVQILKYDGTKFVVKEALPFGSQINEEDALQVHGDFTYWLGSDGFVYGYGSEFADESDFLFIIGQYSTAGVRLVGPCVLAMVSSDQADFTTISSVRENTEVMFIAGETTTATYILKYFYPYAVDTIEAVNLARHQGDIYTPVTLLPSLSNVKHITIMCAPVAGISGSQVEAVVKVYFNQSTTAWASKNVTRDDIAKGYMTFEVNKSFINSIQFEIEHNTNSNIGVADFAPSYAEIIYEDTTTIK